MVWAGVLATVGNPYWLVWWATVGASYYLLFTRYGPVAVVGLFFLGHIALDLAWTTLLAGVVGAGRRRFPETGYRLLLVGSGLFLVGLGGLFLSSGLRHVARWP
ncbi:MAG: LysE family transporter [bacterium]